MPEQTTAGSVSTRWRRITTVVHRTVEGVGMVVGPGRELVVFGGPATMVWAVLDHPGSEGELFERIQVEWPSSVADLAAVRESLQFLEAHALVEIDEARDPLRQQRR